MTNAGTLITFTAETNLPAFDPSAWYSQHLNNSNNIVDFGDARTDGSVLLHREGNVWLLKTWPRQRNFTLELSRSRFDQPAKVQSIGGAAPTVTPVPSGSRWSLPLNGASEYRWTNPPPASPSSAPMPPSSSPGRPQRTTSPSRPPPTLAPPANWYPVTNPVTNTNGQLSVLLPTLGPSQFHRLRLLQ